MAVAVPPSPQRFLLPEPALAEHPAPRETDRRRRSQRSLRPQTYVQPPSCGSSESMSITDLHESATQILTRWSKDL